MLYLLMSLEMAYRLSSQSKANSAAIRTSEEPSVMTDTRMGAHL